MPLNYSDLEISDFSGGITDSNTGAMHGSFEDCNCFVVNRSKKLETVNGYRGLYSFNETNALKPLEIVEGSDEFYSFTKQRPYRFTINSEEFSHSLGDFDPVLIRQTNAAPYAEVKEDSSIVAEKWRDHVIYNTTPHTGEDVGDAKDYRRPSAIVNIDNSGKQAVTFPLGMPEFSGATVPYGVESDPNYYRYKILYKYDYTTYEGVSYTYRGSAQNLECYTANAISASNPITISNIQYLADASYDTVNTKVEIYRADNSNNFLLIAELSSSDPSTYLDTLELADNNNAAYYASNEAVEFSQPPRCGCFKIIGNTAFYGDIIEELDSGEDHKPYRLLQSIPSIPAAVNYTFYDDMNSRIVGIGSANSVPIVLTEREIYRLDGQINADGSGSFRKREISKSAGCISQKSIVEADGMLFFAGISGFYVTDGYQVSEITRNDKYDISSRYKGISSDYILKNETTNQYIVDRYAKRNRITGKYDKQNNRIYWSASTSNAINGDTLFIYDIANKCFTTETSTHSDYTALCFFDDEMLRGDSTGGVLIHSDKYIDGVIPTLDTPVSEWAFTEIPFKAKLAGIDFGSAAKKKWVNSMTVGIRTSGNIAFSLDSFNDGTDYGVPMAVYSKHDSPAWRDESVLWRQSDMLWRVPPYVMFKRRFPKGTFRTRVKQMSIESGVYDIYRSNEYGTAVVTQTIPDSFEAITVELSDTNYKWPSDVVGYSIKFESENYAVEHRIEELNAGLGTIRAIGGTLPIGTTNFIISGQPKRQRFTIETMTYKYAMMEDIGLEDKGK